MHDIKVIRANPEQFVQALARKIGGTSAQSLVGEVLALDMEKRNLQTWLQEKESERNRLSRTVGMLVRQGGDKATLNQTRAASLALTQEIDGSKGQLEQLHNRLEEQMLDIPNVPLDQAPDGEDEKSNRVVAQWGEPVQENWHRPHWELGDAIGMDFEAGVRLAGTRFTVLRRAAATLSRVLGQWMLDTVLNAQEAEEVNVPFLVTRETAKGTGQIPKFEEDLFMLDHGKEGSHLLIPTSEVPVTNLVAGQTLDLERAPLRFAALSHCFRKEAGGAGRDTRGLIRQHQFEKVEMVTVCKPEDGLEEHARMVASAEQVLQGLELTYRKVLLCAGDTGFGSALTYDLEVWMPGSGVWREISSISTCTDFQARRMGTKLRGGGIPWTLNGSGVAVGRALAAVLETGLLGTGEVRLPTVLAQNPAMNKWVKNGVLKAS